MSKSKELQVIDAPVEGKYCTGCAYQSTGVKRVLPNGTGSNGVLIVGDSPWKDEITLGYPFAGAAGKFLDNILSKRGLDRREFRVSNSYWCKPPALGMNDNPEAYPEAQLAMEQCKPYLDELIAEMKPKAILALGNVALRRVTGFDGIEVNHAYSFPTRYDVTAIPTFHPSGLMQGNWRYTIAFILALVKAMEVANGTYSTTDCHIIEDPDPAYVQYSGRGDIEYPLMCDIETPDSLAGRNEEEAEDDPSYQIIRMGFSVSAWAGVSFPYEGDYIQRAKKLIRRAKLLLFWNKNYDLPRLKANGFELHPDVVVVDAMWAWHFLYSDLPKALAFAAPFFYNGYPWKHLFSQKPGFYNGMDNAVQMGVYQGVKRELEKQGRWQRFWDHCVRVDPIYVSMGKAGVKVDKVARFNFMSTLEDEAVKELGAIQSLLPNKCKSIEFLEREPKPVHRLKGDSDLKWRWRQLTKIEQMEVPAYHKDGSKVVTTSNEQMYRPLWKRTTPFNPASHDQVSNLLLALNIPLPKKRGEDRTTVEAKYLKRLADKHPILKHVVEYGKREQLVTTYDWPLDESDRAHTTYGNHPSTWRSSSRNVNLGNIPKRYDLAQLFRSLLIAERGCKLIEIDRSAIEAVLVGYWGKSPEYIKLAKAGVHSFLGSHILGSPVSWETVRDTPLPELRKLLKEFKKIGGIEQYESWKRCIHGSNYLLSAYGMHDEYEEFFPTTYAAQQMQDVYFNSPAGHSVRAYHKATLEEVWGKKYLDNSFNYRHYFYGPIYKFDKRERRWDIDHEGDAKRAVAFRPQSDAAAIQREDILALNEVDWFSGLMRLPTYDSIVVEAPVDKVDQAIELLIKQFAKPIPELGGLEIGFEVKVGLNLRDMSGVSI